ncbi:MAG: circadian clock protein KaiC [Flavobacteriales bacterium]
MVKSRTGKGLAKVRTGIIGLDEVTNGGLPKGRPTLVVGAAGSGKTMLAMEFLVRGAAEFGDPGVFMMFEENAQELTENVRSLGFDLDKLVADKMLVLAHVRVERSEIEVTGEYDLEGLFIRLGHAIDTIGAKRVVLDTLEALFAALPNEAVLRAELRRLFEWLKARGVTAVITGERGENALTRYGLEEYVADCVILMDHRVVDKIATRHLRIVKYRGSGHGTNEYPFLITSKGLSVLPITSLLLEHKASKERISTGVPSLDAMMDGGGYYRGSSILVSGAAGCGKSTLAATFVASACARGERALLFAYEESASQIMRNMASVGIDLRSCERKGLLRIHASRPTLNGLEQHLVLMHDTIKEFKPQVVAIDPISNLTIAHDQAVKPMLMRLIDHLKVENITAVMTSLTSTSAAFREDSEMGVSSLMDTWIALRNVEADDNRTRTLVLLKSRGMAHSQQVMGFTLSTKGVRLHAIGNARAGEPFPADPGNVRNDRGIPAPGKVNKSTKKTPRASTRPIPTKKR